MGSNVETEQRYELRYRDHKIKYMLDFHYNRKCGIDNPARLRRASRYRNKICKYLNRLEMIGGL